MPMLKLRLILLAVLCTVSVACQTSQQPRKISSIGPGGVIHDVKTTAYTHTESDHIVYGKASAVGSKLKYGNVRSAAADWSVYPVGTSFKIEGQPYVYEVDDYGSALVGTQTIDLYTPTKSSMNNWGARKVNIQVLRWGSFARSLAIMKPRENKATSVHTMITEIEQKPRPRS